MLNRLFGGKKEFKVSDVEVKLIINCDAIQKAMHSFQLVAQKALNDPLMKKSANKSKDIITNELKKVCSIISKARKANGEGHSDNDAIEKSYAKVAADLIVMIDSQTAIDFSKASLLLDNVQPRYLTLDGVLLEVVDDDSSKEKVLQKRAS